MASFEETGFSWLRGALDDAALAPFEKAAALNARPGARVTPEPDLLSVLGSDGALGRAVHQIRPAARPVRLVAFNKTPSANWAVPWHQDRVIAVRDRADVPGFSGWSCKAGIWHCEPPVAVLSNMLFLRVHLDDQSAENGAMEIAPGTHRLGSVPADEAAQKAALTRPVTCEAKRGDVLVLDMMILHRSQPAIVPTSRRVFRVDYSSAPLPSPLKWALS